MKQNTIRPVLYGLLALLLAYAGQRALAGDVWFDAALLYGVGALLFVVSLRLPAFYPEQAWAFPAGVLPSWRARPVWLAGGLLLAAVVFAVLGWRGFDERYPDSSAAWSLHIASVACALAAAACADWGSFRNEAPRSNPVAFVSRRLLILVAILLLAVLLRLAWLDTLPFGVWYDEAEHGLQAQRILTNPQFRPVFEGAITGPAHYLYLVAGSFSLFGVSSHSIRLVSVLFGVLAVLAGYGVGRELFGRRIGLVLAFLLAVSSWSITLSRLGMYSTSSTPFFTLATLAFTLAGLRTGKLIHFALAGLWLGLGLAFYTSFRLFVPVVALFLLHSALLAACSRLAFHQWRISRRPAASASTGAPAPSQRRFWLGVFTMGVVAALVVAPLAWFAWRHPDVFWSRLQDTFIFADKSEAERLPALWTNIWKHLMMFNWRGDPNGRHNLPGAPMLDEVTGVLMVLGLAYSLVRLRDPRYALLPLWLGFTLLGGILSLDFEAPQSLRANGALGAAYVLAVVPLAVLLRAWEQSDGRWQPRFVWWPVALLLGVLAVANIRTYFVRQAHDFSAWAAHSTAETLTANLLAELDETTDAFVTSFYNGHPTLRFLLPASRPMAQLATTDQLPLDFAPGRGAFLVMNAESDALFGAAQRLYPNAEFQEVLPPMDGPPVLYTVRLSPEDVASIQGLDGTYYPNADSAGPPALMQRDSALDFDWAAAAPLPQPFSAEWTGVLHVATYGVYELFLQSPADAELRIGDQQVLSGTGVLSGSLSLAAGKHALTVRAVGGPGILQLAWLPPDRPLEVVGPGALYAAPMTANGLLARYFPNGDWREPEINARVEDQLGYYVHVPPLPRPYTVEYTGKIAIPVAGDYQFGLESIDESSLTINGQEVVSATSPNQYVEGALSLDAGLHDLRIRFADRTDHTHLNVYWQPPGASRAIIPPAVLYGPRRLNQSEGSYTDVQLPSLASVVAAASLPAAPLPGAASLSPGEVAPAPRLAGEATVFATGLQQPRGIAVGEDGRVYVSESGGGKVTVFTPDGQIAARLPAAGSVYGEPTDVALDTQYFYVLDAGKNQLWRMALDGSDATPIAVDAELAGRARGLAVGVEGRLWVAATPGGLVAGIDPQSGETVRLPVATGSELGQPSDVLPAADGLVYATDTTANTLLRMDAAGRVERSWRLPRANSIDGPHLASDRFGNLYVTDPEGGRVEKRDPSGEAIGAWHLNELLDQPVKAVGLAVGPDGRIWVTDSQGGSVIVIEPQE